MNYSVSFNKSIFGLFVFVFFNFPVTILTNDVTFLLDATPRSSNDLENVSNDLPQLRYPERLCPAAQDISPCICVKDCEGCPAKINCYNMTNLDELNFVFRKSGDFPFQWAEFHNMSMLYFPAYSFVSKHYAIVFITNSKLVSLFDEPPSSDSVLKTLTLRSIRLQRSIEWELFAGFRHLTEIEISDIPMRKIGNVVGHCLPPQLSRLVLINTNISSIADNAFAPLKKLTHINLMGNGITVVKRSMFPKPFIGLMIKLSNNNIQSLPDDFLADMPYISTLDLSQNSLSTVSELVFGHSPNLKNINFDGNPINCDCDMKWITQRYRLYLEGQCVAPSSKQGKKLADLQSSDFAYCYP